jgi:MarR family transcriptional regulator, transcriptional regulator for hemolysin
MTISDIREPARVRNGRSIHDLCAIIAREAMKRAQAKLADVGLSPGAYNLLRALGGKNDMTIADIKKVLHVESATVSTLIVRMERDCLIKKVPSPNDKRASIIKATPHAIELLRRAEQIMAIEASDITHRLEEGEQVQIIRLLKHVLKNLSSDS